MDAEYFISPLLDCISLSKLIAKNIRISRIQCHKCRWLDYTWCQAICRYSHDSQIPIGIASSHKVLLTNHVSYGYNWVSTNMIGQRPLTMPVFGQWQHAGNWSLDHPSKKRSEIGHTWYMGHASSWFPEIMHTWRLWISFLSNILHLNCSVPTEPQKNTILIDRLQFCNVVGWFRWQK